MWESEQAMKQFRGSGAHAKVMPRLAKWCDEAAYAHWTEDGESIPTWDQAHQHLAGEGRLSPVEHPSKSHSEKQFPRPRLKPLIGNDIKPRGSSRIESA